MGFIIDGIQVGDSVLLIPNHGDIYNQGCIKGGIIAIGDIVKVHAVKNKNGCTVAIQEQRSINDKITIRGSNI